MATLLEFGMEALKTEQAEKIGRHQELLRTHGKPDPRSQSYLIEGNNAALAQLSALKLVIMDFHRAADTLPTSILIALVSNYDAYLSETVRSLGEIRPEAFFSISRTVTLEDLSHFESISSIRDDFIASEVEQMMFESHFEQIVKLEKRFGVKVREYIPYWNEFIELTERRNLFVHNGGIVNQHYLRNCRKYGVDVGDSVQPNRKLEVEWEYWRRAYAAVFCTATLVTFVLLKKLDCGKESDRFNAADRIDGDMVVLI